MKWHKKPLFRIAIVGLLMAGLAEQAGAFRPRVERLRRSTSTSGVRGTCQNRTVQDLTAIAPTSYTAQLTKDHSTVSWYIPEAYGSPIQLKLYRADQPDTEKVKWQFVEGFTIEQYEPGIYSYPLPAALLTEGQVYAWQVEVNCNPINASMNPRFTAQFKVVASPPIQGTTPAEKADQYAEKGLWYSAFAEATIADRQGQKERSKLLIALRDVEAEQIQSNAKDDSSPQEIDQRVQQRREQLSYLIRLTEQSLPK
ncbi:hypothetical protein LEP3755_31190 [Leptolyngbya sp. NIES-3755]|nr:hypothetical protein LEP3755_31190 [Leptolyngbya sp. NIES-3755]